MPLETDVSTDLEADDEDIQEQDEPLPVRPVFVLSRPVVLVGLMGAGKSSIGKRLAKTLHVDFIDSDDEIAAAAARSIPDIFEIYGEPLFRDLEKRVILRLLTESPPAVIATGGGAFVNDEIRATVKGKAISIWLDADIDILHKRLVKKHNRPLLEKAHDKRAVLAELLEKRAPYYRQADMTIASDRGSRSTIVKDIIAALAPHFTLPETGKPETNHD